MRTEPRSQRQTERLTGRGKPQAEERPKLAHPAPGAAMTSPFGMRRHPITGQNKMHEGVDYAAPLGTPIQAMKDGKVVFSGNAGGYGNMVVVKHNDGTHTRYAHNSSNNVQVGQEVKAGDVIAKMGSTGMSTGSHLHFEVRKGDYPGGTAIDPIAYLESNGAKEVAAGTPVGGDQSFAGSDATSVGGGGAPSGMSLGSSGGSSGGSSAGSAGSAGSAAGSAGGSSGSSAASSAASSAGSTSVGGGSAVAAGDFAALLEKLKALGLTEEELKKIAEKNGVPLEMLLGVIMQESGGNPNAKSPVGAAGLMQLMPATAAGLGVSNSLDPRQNVEGGAKYLGQMLKQFGGDKTKALAAYNAGPGNVQKYGGVPPFAETRKYVANITASMDNAKSALA